MAFSREVDHLGDAVLVPRRLHLAGVADVTLDEGDLAIAEQAIEVGQVAGVGELVECHELHRLPARGEQPDKVRADKPGGAGDEEGVA